MFTSKFVNKIGIKNINTTRNTKLRLPKCSSLLLNGIMNELRPSVSPNIIIIVLIIDICGVMFAFDSFKITF